MAAGLPVMALSAMGTADILAPGKGCITPPDDVAAFGQILAHFFNHRQVWTHLGREALHYASTWSDEVMAERLASFYRQLRRHRRALENDTAVAAL
jgi:glycosyltransferase involved in cell wall biosynthesis